MSRKERLSSEDIENFQLIRFRPNNYLLFDITQKSNPIIFAKHIKMVNQKYYFVPDNKTKFSVLKRAKQQDNSKAIEHEVKMLNLVNKSEAKAPIIINHLKYIPMRLEGKLNLVQAISSKKKLSLVLDCLQKVIKNIKDLHKNNIMHMDVALHNSMFPTGELIDFENALEIDSKSGYAKLPPYLFGDGSTSDQDDFPEKCFPFFQSDKKIISPIADCFLLADMLFIAIDLISVNYKGFYHLPFLKKSINEIISTILECDYRTCSVKLLEEVYEGFNFVVETFHKLNNQPKMVLFSQNDRSNVNNHSTSHRPEVSCLSS